MKKMKLFTLTVLTALLTLTTVKTFAQTYFDGYQYLVSTDDYTKFKYTRAYSGSGDVWITTYTIYHPTKGYAYITITATHTVSQKEVSVSVDFASGGIFAHINTQKTTYTTPSLEPFGFRGDVGVLGGNRVPNQLKVKFVSAKYENVNVANVLGSYENNDFEFFVLDDK